MGPASSVADLGSYIAAGLEAITSKEWLGAYKKMRKQEKAYMNLVLPPQTTPAPSVQELQDLSTADATDTQNALPFPLAGFILGFFEYSFLRTEPGGTLPNQK
ncbi:hypothetical protein PInf_007721 [Phytophthora infestans]|nr:hypothetical protein PInf_007721 [Phytophthora infestans]